ncbi:MAG: glutamine-hydrolyzing carbamoyl-phosphate synthase small subunit [Verrucomicrobiota bacterium]
MNKAKLALENGSVFEGHSVGAEGTVEAEVCFNTSMTGYQEILTDPSYHGQMVAMTYPHIGNYGVNPDDAESYQPHVSGFIMRELSPRVSNFRSLESLGVYLERNGIPAIAGIDTRQLTKQLRVEGALKGILTTEECSDEDLIKRTRGVQSIVGQDYVQKVTTKEIYEWDPEGDDSPEWLDNDQVEDGMKKPLPPIEHRIVAYDFGIKYNILRRLREQGFGVTVVPAQTEAKEVLAMKPDGVFLSNGPGDPSAVHYAHESVREIMEAVPVFGICLGHQILAHALGGKTFKLKFGHRGGNQPVKDLRDGLVKITSQNHGFAVDADSFEEDSVEVTHINLNDGTCEGLSHRKKPVFSVQYHPEAAPGPHDAAYFFEQFKAQVVAFKN